MKTKLTSSFKGSKCFIKKYRNIWRRVKHSIRPNMTNTRLIIIFKLDIEYEFNQQGRVEGRRKEVETNQIWSMHHLIKD